MDDVDLDPVSSNPDNYRVIFENKRVRVLEYRDVPGDRTTVHRHPDSFMYPLASFQRRLVHGDQERDVEIQAGTPMWLPAQQHLGENIGESPTHALFVELKEPAPSSDDEGGALGPSH